eukprot:4408142-Alexandrium_andersonii.AAC.1
MLCLPEPSEPCLQIAPGLWAAPQDGNASEYESLEDALSEPLRAEFGEAVPSPVEIDSSESCGRRSLVAD